MRKLWMRNKIRITLPLLLSLLVVGWGSLRGVEEALSDTEGLDRIRVIEKWQEKRIIQSAQHEQTEIQIGVLHLELLYPCGKLL